MALIICGDCGKEISDAAKVCPNCGCPVKGGISVTKDDRMAAPTWLFVLAIIGTCLIWVPFAPFAFYIPAIIGSIKYNHNTYRRWGFARAAFIISAFGMMGSLSVSLALVSGMF